MFRREPKQWGMYFFQVYVDIGAEGSDRAIINLAIINAVGVAAISRLWDIKVTQLECSNARA